MSLSPNRTAVNGAPSPAAAGRGRRARRGPAPTPRRPGRRPPRHAARQTAATTRRADRAGSATTSAGSTIGVARAAQRHVMDDAVCASGPNRSTSIGSHAEERARWRRRAPRGEVRARRCARTLRANRVTRRSAESSGSHRNRRRRSRASMVSKANSIRSPAAARRFRGKPCHELVFADPGVGGQLGELSRTGADAPSMVKWTILLGAQRLDDVDVRPRRSARAAAGSVSISVASSRCSGRTPTMTLLRRRVLREARRALPGSA